MRKQEKRDDILRENISTSIVRIRVSDNSLWSEMCLINVVSGEENASANEAQGSTVWVEQESESAQKSDGADIKSQERREDSTSHFNDGEGACLCWAYLLLA